MMKQRKGLTVRAKYNVKFSHCGPSYRQASGINPPIKFLRQSRHYD